MNVLEDGTSFCVIRPLYCLTIRPRHCSMRFVMVTVSYVTHTHNFPPLRAFIQLPSDVGRPFPLIIQLIFHHNWALVATSQVGATVVGMGFLLEKAQDPCPLVRCFGNLDAHSS